MTAYEILLKRIKQVHRRWRFQVLFRGISLFLVFSILLLLLGVLGGEIFGFKHAAVWTMRLITGMAAVFVALYFLYLPFRRRVSDVQVAQFIEEQYPHLEDRLVSAIEFGEEQGGSAIIDLLIKDALEKVHRVDFSVFVNRKRLAGLGLLGIMAFAVLFILLAWGPAFLPYGFHLIYAPWAQASSDLPMRIGVVPGDVEILKGSDQEVEAQLVGFDASDVHLYVQPEAAETWNPLAMEPKPAGGDFHYLLIDIRSPMHYYVEARGVRSETYSIRVVDLAKVEQIDLTYNFPAYTGMSSQHIENNGDIEALKGTEVDLAVQFDQPIRSAHLLFDNQEKLELSPSGSLDFSGRFILQRSGSYVVQVEELNGKSHEGSSEYLVEALEDAVPVITIVRPMKDVRATSVEEVFSEVKAEDDTGIERLELLYSVNGGPERTVPLYNGKTDEKSVLRSYTFFLEEFGLVPGDLVSYYARGRDNNNVTGPGTASSDIYFIQIRPFEQKYVQSQQSPSQEGSGEEEGQQALGMQQKEIITATHNLIRDKDSMPRQDYSDGLQTLALVQDRLQEQTQGLVDRMERRDAAQLDDEFAQLGAYLKNAVEEMQKAATELRAEKPQDAFPPEQKSLQQLTRAESLFREIQVSIADQNSGTGSGSQANSEDLADLFELEMDKLKNQYETMQRGERQEQDQEVDEALERLKELAQRQQQLNESNRMRARQGNQSSSAGGGSSSASQQDLMDQAEELQRQLERLSRERSSPSLNEANSRIQRAIEEMKKALNESRSNNSSEAGARGTRALQQLNDAARRLDRERQSGLNQQLQQAVGESEKLLKEQERIQKELEQMSEEAASTDSSPGGAGQRAEDIVSRKELMADRLENLENNIRDLSRQARKTQEETSGKLADAAREIRDRQLPERILKGNEMIQSGYNEFQEEWEEYIRNGLEALNQQLQSAQDSMVSGGGENIEDAANRARQLAEGLESLEQQLQEGAQGEQTGASGSNQQGQQQGMRAQTGQGRGQQRPSEQAQSGMGRNGNPSQNPQQRGSDQARLGMGRNGNPSQNPQPGQRGGMQNEQNRQGGYLNPDTEVPALSSDSMNPPRGGSTRAQRSDSQLENEFEQRLRDARELRSLLDRDSNGLNNMDRVIDGLRRAGDYTGYSDPERIAFLKAAIEAMRRVELGLARDLDQLTQDDRYFSMEDNEAPADFQKLVEEYYKSIAKGK